MELKEYVQIKVSADAMLAKCFSVKPMEAGTFSEKDVLNFLHTSGVTFGIETEHIRQWVSDPQNVTFPLIIARGRKPERGKAAYLEATRKNSSLPKDLDTSTSSVDLREGWTIPMASQNEIVARKVEATTGAGGCDVYGKALPGLKGKDFTLRPGKNTALSADGKSLQAIVNGQLSVEGRTVHVYPVYEVPGDITMKTGNIRFNGNVVIHGSVPSGFRISADGDIHIKGSVEASYLTAGGSVFVAEGIAGQGKGEVQARRDVHSGYINQGIVFAGHNIHVFQSILHSHCEAGNALVCTQGKGSIVGGKNTAGRWIKLREAGNALNTSTSFYIGVREQMLKAREEAENTLLQGKEEKAKLQKLHAKLEEKEKEASALTIQDRITKLRIRNTMSELLDKMTRAADTLQDIKSVMKENEGDAIFVTEKAFMNTNVHIGKYKRMITKNRNGINVFLAEGEVVIQDRR
ncbi:FapA family protein [Natribacillus halophilus]|uniref:Flagellar Assembly Protein A N-terminal region domain-containing protein n=1 Tax=Natribacillus halophilus TaxID=549003 RepID=A0A1G8PP62_9BACI|nr:FapA family protein [Natribacillus halophilus]SDI94291.1 hypothetical protein SAMN04488123_10938 [Natribacillus halophilus]